VNGRRPAPLLTALIAWAAATGIVGVIYALWLFSRGEAMQWSLLGEAAGIAAPLALFLAWRDSRRR